MTSWASLPSSSVTNFSSSAGLQSLHMPEYASWDLTLMDISTDVLTKFHECPT